jgi:hypothetical protein
MRVKKLTKRREEWGEWMREELLMVAEESWEYF